MYKTCAFRRSRYTIDANETVFSAALKLPVQANVARTCTQIPYYIPFSLSAVVVVAAVFFLLLFLFGSV